MKQIEPNKEYRIRFVDMVSTTVLEKSTIRIDWELMIDNKWSGIFVSVMFWNLTKLFAFTSPYVKAGDEIEETLKKCEEIYGILSLIQTKTREIYTISQLVNYHAYDDQIAALDHEEN